MQKNSKKVNVESLIILSPIAKVRETEISNMLMILSVSKE